MGSAMTPREADLAALNLLEDEFEKMPDAEDHATIVLPEWQWIAMLLLMQNSIENAHCVPCALARVISHDGLLKAVSARREEISASGPDFPIDLATTVSSLAMLSIITAEFLVRADKPAPKTRRIFKESGVMFEDASNLDNEDVAWIVGRALARHAPIRVPWLILEKTGIDLVRGKVDSDDEA